MALRICFDQVPCKIWDVFIYYISLVVPPVNYRVIERVKGIEIA